MCKLDILREREREHCFTATEKDGEERKEGGREEREDARRSSAAADGEKGKRERVGRLV